MRGVGKLDAGRTAIAIGAVAAIAAAICAFVDLRLFLQGWLVGFVLVIGFSVGSLLLLMLYHLTGGAWGFVLRRPAEAAAATMPFAIVVFLPLIAGMRLLFPWSTMSEAELGQKAVWLDPLFFSLRGIVIIATLAALGVVMRKWSLAQDTSPDPDRLALRMQRTSAWGLVVVVLFLTFGAWDWLMSLQPEWTSAMFAGLVIVRHLLSATALLIVTAIFVERRRTVSLPAAAATFAELGNLLLLFLAVLVYFAFSQFVIIWSGDLPDEIAWYLLRQAAPWNAIGAALLAFHIAIPIALLVLRPLRKIPLALGGVAALVVVMTFADIAWLALPSMQVATTGLSLIHAVVPIAIAAIWALLFLALLRNVPPLSKRDMRMREARMEPVIGAGVDLPRESVASAPRPHGRTGVVIMLYVTLKWMALWLRGLAGGKR